MGINEPKGIRISLKLNKKNDVSIYEDEPLTLTISIVNNLALTANSANAYYISQINDLKKKLELRKISEDDFKAKLNEFEKKLAEVKTFVFGGPEGWTQLINIWVLEKDNWIRTNWPWKHLLHHPRSQVVKLNGKTSCIMEVGLDPEDVNRPKGKYIIKAILEIAPNKNIESNTCTVNFITKRMQKTEKESEPVNLNLGRYTYKRLQLEKSMEYADLILSKNQNSILAWSLKGEIEETRGELDKAETAYLHSIEAYWKQVPADSEPPISLQIKLTRVQSRKLFQ
ncbi:hypothetical protein FJY84_07175 [Candidatus Bathyarchaeota archaeon]|nr:hypothetical protein [Candidatus Bathyarchaeota archaeon]